jgi:flagellin
MTINANGAVSGAAAALAALQALQLSTSASNPTPASSGSTSTGSASALSQTPLLIYSATSQTSPSQATADGLAQGAALTDAAGAAAQAVSELLAQIQKTATTAAQANLSSASRQALTSAFSSQISGFSALLASAQINGQNLLNGSLTANPTFATPAGGTLSVQTQDLTLGGPLVSLSSNASVSTASAAASTASLAGVSITAVDAAIGQIYDQGDQISDVSAQLGAAQLGGSSTIGGSGDPSGDSVGLIALQLQQTLSEQPSISLSNPSSQAILALFRG